MRLVSSKLNFILALTCFSAYSALNAAIEVQGTVVSTSVQTVDFGTDAGFIGNVDYVARLGQIITPSVKDSNNNIVTLGTPLCSMKYGPWSEAVKAAYMGVLTSKDILEMANYNYARYKTLTDENATSKEQLTDMTSHLASSLGQYENSVASLIMDKDMLAARTTMAPFEGIVTKVLFGIGNATGRPPTLEITQLNGIAIQIKLPREQQRAINSNTPIKIYPMGSDQALGVYNGFSYLGKDSIYFITDNYPILEKNVILKNDKTILRDWMPVVRFDMNTASSKVLAVPEKSLQNDSHGDFVWRAKGQKIMQPDKGIYNTFEIEKIYVKQSDRIRYQSSYTRIIALADQGKLGVYDLVLNNPPKNLTDGQSVYFPLEAYLLMPGDSVKVVIGDGPLEKLKSN